MRGALITVCVLSVLPVAVAAQRHTIVALSHSDFTAYEVDPTSGKILNQFKALNQPHEGVASPDGKTFYAAIPNGPHVVMLYIMNSGEGDVAVIDLKGMKLAARHKVGVNPFGGGLRLLVP